MWRTFFTARLLRILNRDLKAADIPKVDEYGRRVHVHALRQSTGTQLSAANVSPRTAQAVMRHSDIALTMNTYTDERLLNAAGAVEMLPDLGSATGDRDPSRTVALSVALDSDKKSQNGSKSVKMGELERHARKRRSPEKPNVLRGEIVWAIQNSNL